MKLEKDLQELTNCNNSLSSFKLTQLWLSKVEDVSISASAAAVMTALLWHYNPQHRFIFPHQATIAKRIKRSVATVKRGIAELKQAGFIISVRSRSGNKYALTKKFFELLEPCQSANCTIKKVQNEPSHDHEQIKEHVNNKVVFLKDFSDKEGGREAAKQLEASSTADFGGVASRTNQKEGFEEIPQCLKDKAAKGEIRNLQGYWRSLRPFIKEEYREIDRQEAAKRARIEALRQEEAKAKEAAAAAEIQRQKELELPLNARYSRDAAITMLRNFKRIKKGTPKGFMLELMQAFNISFSEI